MKHIIFLDDERNIEDVTWIKYPKFHSAITVRNFHEFKYVIPYVKDWNNTYFSFDHDLQDFNEDGSENTGYDCLKWLCDYIMDNDIKNLNVIVLQMTIHPDAVSVAKEGHADNDVAVLTVGFVVLDGPF